MQKPANRNYIPEEGLGPGRKDSGVLIKLLDAAERLGIQVHPTPDFSRKYFGTNHGKTECWHILDADKDASIYIGFKEGITKEKWAALFAAQNIQGMLDCLHRFEVKKGDKIFVPFGCKSFTVVDAEVIVCHPPLITSEK